MKYETVNSIVKWFLCVSVGFAVFMWTSVFAEWFYRGVNNEQVASLVVKQRPLLQPHTYPELVSGARVRFSADQVLEHVTLINKGAALPIYFVDDPDIFCWFVNFPPEWSGLLYGTFHEDWRLSGPRIVVWGDYTREVGVFAHEYTHFLESEIPWAREEIRKTFQKFFTEDFNIGARDLNGPAEPNTVKGETVETKEKDCIVSPE